MEERAGDNTDCDTERFPIDYNLYNGLLLSNKKELPY